MAQDNTQGTLSSMIPQGTPSAPTQQPPSFGQKLLGNKEYSVEINDAVMETEAWRSSRYNGRQLEASQINVSTIFFYYRGFTICNVSCIILIGFKGI